jgi:hypothetical protein
MLHFTFKKELGKAEAEWKSYRKTATKLIMRSCWLTLYHNHIHHSMGADDPKVTTILTFEDQV